MGGKVYSASVLRKEERKRHELKHERRSLRLRLGGVCMQILNE